MTRLGPGEDLGYDKMPWQLVFVEVNLLDRNRDIGPNMAGSK